MRRLAIAAIGAVAAAAALTSARPAAQVTSDAPARRPAAIVDLSTDDGVRLLGGTWRYGDARIVEVAHRSPGPDLRASGPPNRTHDIEPKAGARNFDDSGWAIVPPAGLTGRRGTGRLSFGWYRTTLTVPQRVGDFDTSGSTVVLETVVDDYAEIWVNGELPQALGQSGGSLVRGWNAPNRVVLSRSVKPGDAFEIAIFGANGPLSNPPGNFIWIRSAVLEFYRGSGPGAGTPVETVIARRDPRLDEIIAPGTKLEKLAGGFTFTEGPVWHPDGYLLFSDPNDNAIYRWSANGGVSVFRAKSGYTGVDVAEYGQPGSNGLAIDPEGRLTINEHGNRRVTRVEQNGLLTVLANRFEGRRLNSPNDLVYRADGSLYFTDPPFGLPRGFDDPRKELAYSGIYRLAGGQLQLLARDLTGPNGLAFSPDERFLYVGNWDEKKKVVMRYPVLADGTLGPGHVFYDMTSAPGDDALDGVKVDRAGNVYVSGPGGLWILAADGTPLGVLSGPEHPHNLAWGDADRRTLYLTAQTGLYRVRLLVAGAGAAGPTTSASR